MGIGMNGRAMLAMFVSTAAFIFNSAIFKYAAHYMPTGQFIFLEGVVTCAFMGVLSLFCGNFRVGWQLLHPTVLARCVLEVASTLMYMTALTKMPMANVSAVLQAMPLMVTAGAAVFYGEVVGWRRWSAIALGFVGVLLVLQPDAGGFDLWSTLALGSVLCRALRDLVTRAMPKGLPCLSVCFVVCVSVTLMGLGVGVAEEWVVLEGWHALPVISGSFFQIAAYILALIAVRFGDMVAVAPVRYTGLLWAAGLGVLIWGHVPDMLTGAGMGIIVASGLYMVYREHVRASEGRKMVRALKESSAESAAGLEQAGVT
ncbi:DMT family transporter [Flexibacterium corallicola]|uniref:DMT family transporter n=1 Tax=Flexibacterium corallicola TaxID=3037259 RepID=UPI00286F69E6|nr:DMT family transporter [Pseudovibrio sp. M1P-2-3]